MGSRRRRSTGQPGSSLSATFQRAAGITEGTRAAIRAAEDGTGFGYSAARAALDFEVRPNPDAALARDFISWPLKIDADGPMPALADAVARSPPH
ncbi:hypothetical protein ACIGXI_22995 [Kitasatospora aureofaciens]|uniref:hypothetical protein n=1 Tax=Kitasatospora aureofaciens TaxID=1894 RepID=UPI0037CA734F